MFNFSDLKNCPVLSKKDLCIIGNLQDCIFDENLNQIAYFLCIKDDAEFLVSAKDISAINDAFILDDCSLRSISSRSRPSKYTLPVLCP